jgi:hypothetical protein
MIKLTIVLAGIKWFMSDVFSDHTRKRSTICSNVSGDALLLVDIFYLEIDSACFKVTNSEIGVTAYLIWMSAIMLRTTQWLSDNLLALKALEEHVDVDELIELLCENKLVLWDDTWGIISHCTMLHAEVSILDRYDIGFVIGLICFFLHGLSWQTTHWIIGLDLLGSYNYMII